ncbi:MAG: DUF1385 domain-containing protein [Acidimicrobiia bacterium]|nr:DUF1385 domain-containing protein [Acidimicrobiia bacterium]
MSRAPGSTVGGQAVIEGVMMRAPEAWSIAVRRPDGVIESTRRDLPGFVAHSRMRKVPFIRGILVLGESLSLGFRALSWSAQKAGEEEEEELRKRDIAFAMVFGIVFFVSVFIVAPLLVANAAERFVGDSSIAFNLVDGLVRVSLFLLYIWAIGLNKDIRRVFEYHGAEHKTIHAYEAGDPLQLDAIQKYSPRHPRCGTNFLMIVVILALVVFTLIGRPRLVLLIASRVVFIPIIAGISYELLKAAAQQRWLSVASKPGIWLQRLTTREPDGEQVEVAVASLLAALSDEEAVAVGQRGPIIPGALAAETS